MTVQMRGSEGAGEGNRLIMWLGGLQAERGKGGRKKTGQTERDGGGKGHKLGEEKQRQKESE